MFEAINILNFHIKNNYARKITAPLIVYGYVG